MEEGRHSEAIQGLPGLKAVRTTYIDALKETQAQVQAQEMEAAITEQARTSQEVARQLETVNAQVARNSAATTEMSASIQEVNHTAGDLAKASDQLREAIGQYQV